MSVSIPTNAADSTDGADAKRADVERFVSESGIALAGEREISALWRQAKYYAQMPGLAPAYKGKPEAVMAAALTAHSLDLPVNPIVINQFYEVNGRLFPSTQILVALGRKHGVDVWFDETSDGQRAVAYCKRPGEERVHSYLYTIEMARTAGLAGKDVWKQHPEVMLRYRAASRLMRTVCPDVTLGIPRNVMNGDLGSPPMSREDLQARAVPIAVVDDDEITDGEIVDDGNRANAPDLGAETTPTEAIEGVKWMDAFLARCAELAPAARAGAMATAIVRKVSGGERSEPMTLTGEDERAAAWALTDEVADGRWTLTIVRGTANLAESKPAPTGEPF
jgi:hypothetical protein